jgi:hypothetical protein
LKSHDWEVDWKEDVQQAIAALATGVYDTLILDHLIPVEGRASVAELWSGLAIFGWLRDSRLPNAIFGTLPLYESSEPLDANKRIPVCFISAFYDDEIEAAIRLIETEGEPVSRLSKPIASENLIEFLESVVNRDHEEQK